MTLKTVMKFFYQSLFCSECVTSGTYSVRCLMLDKCQTRRKLNPVCCDVTNESFFVMRLLIDL